MPNKEHLWASLIGHLRIDERREEFSQLRDLLSRALVPEDAQQLKASNFSFEGSDLFARENIAAERGATLEQLARSQAASEFRVFVREVPLRSTQLHGSNPFWASGAAPERTLGPFLNRDGRRFWFDFFRIEKLVALYVQGVPEPALLFKIRTGFQFIGLDFPLAADARDNYRLNAGSIWINSSLLASNAPLNFFTGLTIRGGSITLDATPQTVDGRLTVTPNTTVRVELQLQQQTVNDADPASAYGKDARAAEIELPPEFAFHFAGGNHALDAIGGSSWRVYGHEASFDWRQVQVTSYDLVLNRVLIPLTASTERFEVTDNQSPFHTLSGETKVAASFWALPTAAIDVANPSAAEGIGALLIRGEEGLNSNWTALKGGPVNLKQPYVMAAPGRIGLTDLSTGNSLAQQDFKLWQDKLNPFGTTAKFQYSAAAPFFFNTMASGVELISTFGDADVRADRPVTARGEPLEIRSKKSLLIIGATSSFRLFYLFDDNMLADNTDPAKKPPQLPKPLSLVLSNALFKTTAVNGCLLFGTLAEDFVRVDRGSLFLTLGLHAYLPTLPDPYAANIEQLKFQFRVSDERSLYLSNQPSVWLLLICRVKWEPAAEEEDQVKVSFHFAPLPNQPPWTDSGPANDLDFVALIGGDANAGVEPQSQIPPIDVTRSPPPPPDYGDIWEKSVAGLQRDQFALLDVSTNADLLGVSFGSLGSARMAMQTTLLPAETGFPLQVKGMEVVSRGVNVRAFTVPQISWEPVINLTPPAPSLPDPFNPTPPTIKDPPFGPNYYPDDGGPTRLINNSADQVALAPIPLSDFLVENFADKENFAALSLFTLPFGMRALALLQRKYFFDGGSRPGADLRFNARNWDSGVTGARQLQIDGGQSLREGESDMFMGSTIQVDNILDTSGDPTGTTTLGQSVSEIFNNEFLLQPFQILRQRGVPLSRMDLSGYGASIFSEWRNPKAGMAETSQAKFEVFVGRCALEVIQVRTILYPYAVKMVRTITLFRANSGYFYRFDSGWQPESDGRFDFTYYVYVPKEKGSSTLVPSARDAGYPIHPGIVHGLFQVKNVRETTEVERFTGAMQIPPGDFYVDINGQEVQNTSGDNFPIVYNLQPVFFDADVEIENPVSGFITKEVSGAQRNLVPSKRILGFVQLAPRGIPLTVDAFKDLIVRQGGNIGGPIDCVVDIGRSGQQMRLNRFDVSNSFEADGFRPAFAAPGRGSVLLPKDGSWSLVKHEAGTGEVSPVPPDLSAPLIRNGRLFRDAGDVLQLDPKPADALLRIANPTELLRPPTNDTINYGFLQSTDTQKALFLTPSFQKDLATLLSKTPPLFADAFRVVKSKGIFPNIGDAVTNFGDVISLVKKGTEFKTSTLPDGTKVLELMQINDGVDAAKKEGYKLLKKVEEGGFDLPGTEVDLINLSGTLRIYLEYKAQKANQPKADLGKLDFDVDSFANDAADQWKSKMSNVAVVVDLGPIPRLMTIKGNWDSKKGAEASYGGNPDDPSFPAPQIEFAEQLQPVIEILQILQDLQTADYKDAFKTGLKLAMSNKAGSWEYKLEASKEIPVVKFPPFPLSEDPNAPLKLEAGLRLGAYFNAALKVSDDPKDLLPTAGAFLGFYGRLSVMCVSLSIATVYAVGQVTLDIAADSKGTPSLRMKFGFGAQIVVGLPVVGNVSVLYMVGVEIFTDATQLNVSAFMLYQGHAELAAGLVSVTITIEAKGTIKRLNDRTDLEAQITFGLDISVFLVIDISFSKSWSEQRQIA
jgi:hypothetical protein